MKKKISAQWSGDYDQLSVTHKESSIKTTYVEKISYAKKKNGKYKEIKQDFYGTIDVPRLLEFSNMKKGKTYYIRVRFFDRTVQSEKIYSTYSKPVKIKL